MPTKANEKWKSFLHCISSFEGTSYEHLSGKAIRSISFCFYKLLHSRYLFFRNIYYFIQHYLKKNIFVTNFPFSANSLIPPTITTTTTLLHSCNGQNLISMAKVFCWCSLSMNSVYDFWDTFILHRFLEPFWWNKSVWKEGWTLYAKFLTCVTCYNHI